MATLTVTSCQKADKNLDTIIPDKFNSYSELTKLILQKLEKNINRYGALDTAEEITAEADDNKSATQNKTEGALDYSKTNLQVTGVDEADIIKTDGKYLYIIANNKFIIVDVNDFTNPSIMSEINYDENKSTSPIEMFLDTENKIVTIISRNYDYRSNGLLKDMIEAKPEIAPDSIGAPDIFYPGIYWGNEGIVSQIIDVSDVKNPKIKREFSQEGSYLSSRRINEYVYVISSKYIYNIPEEEDKDYLIPEYKDSVGTAEWEKYPLNSILALESGEYNNYILVSGIKTTNESKVNLNAILGGGENIYASPDSLYILVSDYSYGTDNLGEDADATVEGGVVTKDNDLYEEEISIDKDLTWQIIEPKPFTVFTNIYKFNIDKGKVDFVIAGEVPGYIINQFSMDEYDGYFRIATTSENPDEKIGFSSINNLYVLNEKLQIVGKVEGLALSETIKSVRFAGNKAYMVTFRTVDPLFVFDLSNPVSPKTVGELKIPGYSEYLHPVNENMLLGFGMDATAIDGGAIETGFKVSLFDVSDMKNPKEVSSFKIGDRGTYSEVLYNHKSLLFSKEKNIIGFPITITKIPEKIKNDNWAYGMPVFSGYIVLGLTEEYEIYEKGRINHLDAKILSAFSKDKNNNHEIYNYTYIYNVKRGLFIKNALITFSDYKVKISSLDEFKDIGNINLPGFQFNNPYDDYPQPYEGETQEGSPPQDEASEPGSPN